MSFSDRPGYGSWQHILGFVIAFLVIVANLLVFAGWIFSFYDLSTDEVRSVRWVDFILMPSMLLLSFGIIKLYVRFVVRD